MALLKIVLFLVVIGLVLYVILTKMHPHRESDASATDHLNPLHHRHSLKHLLIQGYKDWEQFKHTHSKEYTDKHEEMERMLLFISTQQLVQSHNDAFERGETTFQMGLNHLSDLTPEEYQQMNGFRLPTKEDIDWVLGEIRNDPRHGLLKASEVVNSLSLNGNFTPFVTSDADVPDSIDWREHDYVTPVKDQGKCGSCWAFSVTGTLEGQQKRVSQTLTSLSEQNLLDCSGIFGNKGCDGGNPMRAYFYIILNGGLDTEESYPYFSYNGQNQTCKFTRENVGARAKNYKRFKFGDEESMKNAVGTLGPVAVAIDASHKSFQEYKSGVYFEPQCDAQRLNHGVLVVGYGTDDGGNDYWLVKNSWGSAWGDGGYIKMARNKNNNCGIASLATFPIV